MAVGTGINPLPQGLAIIDSKNFAATKEFWWFLLQLQNRRSFLSETLGTIGNITPSGGATYHRIDQTGDVVIKAPSAGTLDGQPHTFKIKCNGHAVTLDPAYIGMTGVVIVTTAGKWNTLTFMTEPDGVTFNLSTKELGIS